jgi:methylisocitrate lyase
MMIWPVTSLRIEARAVGELYATLADKGSAESLLARMQPRAELYETIGLADYEALDSSIVATVLPQRG